MHFPAGGGGTRDENVLTVPPLSRAQPRPMMKIVAQRKEGGVPSDGNTGPVIDLFVRMGEVLRGEARENLEGRTRGPSLICS